MKKSTYAILISLLCGVGLVYFQSRGQVGSLRQSVGLVFKSPQAALSPEMTRIMAGEFSGLMADYLLLEVGSFDGSGAEASKSDYQNIYRTLKRSLALDPYFQQTYFVVQGLLPWKAKMVDEAIELLEISRKHRPWDWIPGHYMGFDYYFFKSDFTKASEILLETAKIKHSPVLLAVLGARFAAKGQRTEAAVVMLRQMLKDKELPEYDRHEIEERLAALNGVVLLEKAIGEYQSKVGRFPSDLAILVKDGLIGAFPPNPYADTFYYDPETGHVSFDQIKTRTSSSGSRHPWLYRLLQHPYTTLLTVDRAAYPDKADWESLAP